MGYRVNFSCTKVAILVLSTYVFGCTISFTTAGWPKFSAIPILHFKKKRKKKPIRVSVFSTKNLGIQQIVLQIFTKYTSVCVCVISSLIDLLPRKRVHVFGISCRKTNGMDWTQTQLGNGLGSLFIRLPTSTLWTLEKWRHEISGALGSSLHHHHKGRRHEQGHGQPQRSAPPDQHQPNRHCPLATGPPFSYLNPLAAGRLDHAH